MSTDTDSSSTRHSAPPQETNTPNSSEAAETSTGAMDRTVEKTAAEYLVSLGNRGSEEALQRINSRVRLTAPVEEVEALAERGRRGDRRGKITWASEYEMRNVKWLWEKRIPIGMISGLYGVEGMGKSMETVRIAAAVTRGDLPGALKGEPRKVLIATTEDTWQHTIAPRLKAAGADMDMVGHYRIAVGDDGDEAPELPRDADILADDVRGENVALVILDPVVSHLDAKAESHKTKDVRKALEPLHRVAEQQGFAVLGIMHFNKEKSTDTRQRSQMSSAFREVFRSTLVFGPDPDNPKAKDSRVVALDKNNLVAAGQPSYRMRIEDVTLADVDPDTGEPIKTARIVLGEECAFTAEELLEAAAGADPKAISPEVRDAILFLDAQLEANGGSVDVGATKVAAKAAEISETSLDKAKRRRGLKSVRKAGSQHYEWRRPSGVGVS